VVGVGGKTQLEYPLKATLFETGGSIICPRVSPAGDAVAFIHQPLHGDNSGYVMVVGRDARVMLRTEQWPDIVGLAWSPDGREVWFTASKRGANRALYAVDTAGQVRLIESLPSRLTLTDISADGGVLITRTNYQCGMVCLAPGEPRERDLYWLDGSVGTDLSDDGKHILFVEAREGADRDYGIYLRKTDGSPAVLLGEGFASDLSPDGKWVLSIPVGSPAQIVLLPTGVGEKKALSSDSIHHLHDFESFFNLIGPRWFPDGSRVLFTGVEPDHDMRCYVQDVAGGAARPISPEDSRCVALSPDGTYAAGLDGEGKVWLYPTAGGEPRPAEGLLPGEEPIRWAQDGDSLYVQRKGELPARIYRVSLSTGRRALWKELAPADANGLIYFDPILVTPDGKSYAYSYARGQNDLYLIEGLR
jgi:Tol biopolymer transport system component